MTRSKFREGRTQTTRIKREKRKKPRKKEEVAWYRNKKPSKDKRKKYIKKRERNETKRERRDQWNDWSIWAPEWYQAQPIGTVHHLRDIPFIDQAPVRRTKPSREDREDPYQSPFSVLPPSLFPPFRERRMQTPVHGGCETIDQLPTCHLELGIRVHFTQEVCDFLRSCRDLLEENDRLKAVSSFACEKDFFIN